MLQSMKSDDLRERLEESEKLMNEMEKTWEDKLKETERIHMVIGSFCHYLVLFLGRLPKVDLIILEGENVRLSIRPQKVSSISMKFGI